MYLGPGSSFKRLYLVASLPMSKQHKHKANQRDSGVRHVDRLHRLNSAEHAQQSVELQRIEFTQLARATLNPPAPPIVFTPVLACDPSTPTEVLWRIAQEAPLLRRWIVANPKADAALLEYISQTGGPGVKEALEVLVESLKSPAEDQS